MSMDEIYFSAVDGNLSSLEDNLKNNGKDINGFYTVDNQEEEWKHQEIPLIFSILSKMTESKINYDILDLLVKYGVDFNCDVTLKSEKITWQRPIIEYAVSVWKDVKLVEYLLKNGADPNRNTRQFDLCGEVINSTIQIWYALNSYEDTAVLEVLLKNGANPNGECIVGSGIKQEVIPAAYYALCEFENFEACVLLLRYGAWVNPKIIATNDKGQIVKDDFLRYICMNKSSSKSYRWRRASELAVKKETTLEEAQYKKANQKRKKKTSISKQIGVFAVLFFVCFILGSLFNGDVKNTYAEGIYSFFYCKIPDFLGTVVGLPIKGGFGAFITLILSAVICVAAFKLYDKTSPENKILPFDGSVLYLAMIGSVAIEPMLAETYSNHKIACLLPVIFFVIHLFYNISQFKKNKKDVLDRLGRTIAYIGFIAGISGFSSVVLHLGIEQKIIPSSLIAQVFLPIANAGYKSSALGISLILFICAFAILTAVSYYLFRENCGENSSVFCGAWICSIIALISYSPVRHIVVFSREVKYWFVLVAIIGLAYYYAAFTYGFRRKTLINGIIATISAVACFNSISFFYGPFNESFGEIIEKNSSQRETIQGFFSGLLKIGGDDAQIGGWLISGLIALIVCAIAFLSWGGKRGEEYEFVESPGVTKLCSLIFLVGISLRSCGWNNKIVHIIAFILIVSALFFLLFRFVFCLVQKKREVVKYHVIGLVVTALLIPMFYWFAQGIGMIVAAAFGVYYVIATVVASMNSPRSKSDVFMDRMKNAIEYSDKIDQLNEDIANGKSESLARIEAEIAAGEAIERDRELRDELDNM